MWEINSRNWIIGHDVLEDQKASALISVPFGTCSTILHDSAWILKVLWPFFLWNRRLLYSVMRNGKTIQSESSATTRQYILYTHLAAISYSTDWPQHQIIHPRLGMISSSLARSFAKPLLLQPYPMQRCPYNAKLLPLWNPWDVKAC